MENNRIMSTVLPYNSEHTVPDPRRQFRIETEIMPASSWGEIFDASMEMFKEEGHTNTIMNAIENERLKDLNEPLMSPEELNEAFPNMEVPFVEPTKFSVANAYHERLLRKKHLERIISNSEGMGAFSAQITGALAAYFTDPVAIATDIALTKGLHSVLKGFAATARIVDMSTKGWKGRTAITAAENFIVNTPQEIALHEARFQERMDYETGDIVQNSLVSAVAFSGLTTALGAGFNYMKRWKQSGSKKTLDAMSNDIYNNNMPSMDQLNHYDMVEIKESIRRQVEAEVKPPPTVTSAERIYWGATPREFNVNGINKIMNDPYMPSNRGAVDTGVGSGIYMYNSRRAAAFQGLLHNPTGNYNNMGYDLTSFRIKEGTKILNLNTAPDATFKSKIRSILDGSTTEDFGILYGKSDQAGLLAYISGEVAPAGMDVSPNLSKLDVLENIRDFERKGLLEPGTLEKVNDALRAEGWQGYEFSGMDFDKSPDLIEGTMVFDASSLEPLEDVSGKIQRVMPDIEAYGEVLPDQMKIDHPTKKLFYDPDRAEFIKDIDTLPEPPPATKQIEMDVMTSRQNTVKVESEVNAKLSEFKDPVVEGVMTPEMKEIVKAIEEGIENFKTQESAFKSMLFCKLGGE